MEELKRLLIQAGDEYLTGLSNRGMVKRAYKDLEQETPEVSWNGNEAEVRLKDAVCRIKVPLGDSAAMHRKNAAWDQSPSTWQLRAL